MLRYKITLSPSRPPNHYHHHNHHCHHHHHHFIVDIRVYNQFLSSVICCHYYHHNHHHLETVIFFTTCWPVTWWFPQCLILVFLLTVGLYSIFNLGMCVSLPVYMADPLVGVRVIKVLFISVQAMICSRLSRFLCSLEIWHTALKVKIMMEWGAMLSKM